MDNQKVGNSVGWLEHLMVERMEPKWVDSLVLLPVEPMAAT